MPEKPSQERTEQATPERLRKSREKGNIPEAREVASALVLIALLVTLAFGAGNLFDFFASQARQGLAAEVGYASDIQSYSAFVKSMTAQCAIVIMPFLLVTGVVSAFAGVIGSGWSFSPKALRLQFDKINPISGMKNLISFRSLFILLISIVKMVVLGVIAWTYLNDKLEYCLALRWQSPEATLGNIARLIFGLVARVAVGILTIAMVDWLYQRWNYKRKLKMTKQEVKQEMKDKEVPAMVKRRIRVLQMEMARRRMLQDVPDADVVITNPTHVAVALRYEPGEMGAPIVVAKGPDLLCLKIKEIARANKVPIVQRPELARAIFRVADVGEAIPETLFVAVAEILAMVYRAQKNKAFNAGEPISG